VRYGVEHEHLLVWLDLSERVEDGRGGMLCRRHADTMVVPVGWTLDDRREPMPQLFRAPRGAAPVVADAPRRRRAAAPVTAVQLDLTDQLERPDLSERSDVDDVPPAGDGGGTGTDDTGWMPVFDQHDDLDGLLRPQTPLLARAFQQRTRRADD
jgi:hypothetical protein